MEIGERIKMRREELGLSQTELAKKVGYTSRSSIAKLETNANGMTQSKIIEFAKALNTTPSYLMGWEDDKKLSISSTLSEKQHLILEKYNQLNTIGQCKTEAYIDGLLENKEYLKINSADDITYSTQVAAFGGAAKKGELKKSDVQYLNEEMEEFDN